MKYAIYTPADQTIVFVDNDDSETVVHAKARLFDTKDEAESFVVARNLLGNTEYYIEEVPDVEEFQSREDTW